MSESLLRSVIRVAVPELAHPLAEAPSGVPDARAWTDLLAVVADQRVIGVLWKAIEAGMPVTPLQRIGAATMAHDSMASVVSLEATAQWTVDVLEAAGVDVRLIKGLATAHAVHADPRLRDSGDVDLLVAPSDFLRAREVLAAAGLTVEARWGEGAVGFMKEQVFLTGDGVEIDLHQSLNFGERWRRLTPSLMTDGLRVGRGPGAAGPAFTTLNIEGLFVSAAVSASRSDGRLSGLLDVAALSHDPRLDPERLTALIDSVGLGPAISPVLERAGQYFSLGEAAVAAVERSRATPLNVAVSRVEQAESGARYLYSCLSGSPRTWGPGLRALVFPDASHFGSDDRPRGRLRRLATQSAAVLSPTTWRQPH